MTTPNCIATGRLEYPGQPNSSLPFTSSIMNQSNDIWSHTVPNKMPWISGMSPVIPQPQNPVMQFTGTSSTSLTIRPPDPCSSQIATQWELLNNFSANVPHIVDGIPNHLASTPLDPTTCTVPTIVPLSSSHLHLKRRSSSSEDDDDDIPQPPTKQYISEGRLFAKFNQMKISSSSDDAQSNVICQDEDLDLDLDSDENEHEKRKNRSRLHISDEVNRMLNGSKTILDRMIDNEYDKAAKAIVLWQPLGVFSPELSAYRAKLANNTEDDNNKIESKVDSQNLPISTCDDFPIDVEPVDVPIMDSNDTMDL
ncbi:uncharacterized protein LOC141855712 isoform X2 [Brevipalpus obovatus]|uniref:uncharacterized protein LOC141855712 isoform X2 n=1 Tax=Brevipalpus obovatus TaxID=246614 RepID=UPI003D9F411C